MRNAFIAGCIAIACVGSVWGRQQKPAAQSQNATPATRPQTNVIPDTFTNLQVLPKDITKPHLVGVMKQFSITFGVRCSYCHSVSDDLTEGSFESDDKEAKRKARDLIKAIQEISVANPQPH